MPETSEDISLDETRVAPGAPNAPSDRGEPTVEPRTGDREPEAPAELESPAGTEAAAEREAPAHADVTAAAEPDAGDAPEPVDLTPVSLRFTAAERRFLGRLLPLLDTSPRGIKRYINIYHLIKSVTGIDGADDATDGAAPHECAMLLLALQTGLPAVGADLVRRLAVEPARTGADAGAVTLGGLLRNNTIGNRSVEAGEEIARLEDWLAYEQTDWPLASLASNARHVRLYNYS